MGDHSTSPKCVDNSTDTTTFQNCTLSMQYTTALEHREFDYAAESLAKQQPSSEEPVKEIKG